MQQFTIPDINRNFELQAKNVAFLFGILNGKGGSAFLIAS